MGAPERPESWEMKRRWGWGTWRGLGEGIESGAEGVEVGVAEFSIGLEVIAFGPFVPGLDEDEIFFGGSMGDGMESFLEVRGEEFGGGAMEDRAGSAGAGGVIPTWDDGGVATEGDGFWGMEEEDGVAIEVNAAGVIEEALADTMRGEAGDFGESAEGLGEGGGMGVGELGEGEAFFGDMMEAFVEEFEFIGDDGGLKAEGFPREIEFVVEEMSDEVDPWEAILGG